MDPWAPHNDKVQVLLLTVLVSDGTVLEWDLESLKLTVSEAGNTLFILLRSPLLTTTLSDTTCVLLEWWDLLAFRRLFHGSMDPSQIKGVNKLFSVGSDWKPIDRPFPSPNHLQSVPTYQVNYLF